MEAQESRLGCQTYSPRVGTNPIKVLFRPSDFKNCVLNLNHLVNCNRLPQSLILLLRFRFFHYTLNGSILKLVSTRAPEDQRQSSLSDIVPFKSICLFFISSFLKKKMSHLIVSVQTLIYDIYDCILCLSKHKIQFLSDHFVY